VNNYLKDIPTSKVCQYEKELLNYVKSMTPEILEEIAEKKQISDDLKKKLASTIQKFTESFNK
jgi:F-type H+-transporting ATPase subunit alpha